MKSKFLINLGFICLLVLASGIITPVQTEVIQAGAGAVIISPMPDRYFKTGTNLYYGISAAHGFMVSTDGRGWVERNQGLPQKNVYPFKEPRPRPLTALGVDPLDPLKVAVTTSTRLYFSENGGESWREIPLHAPISGGTYLTSVALTTVATKVHMLIGTAFAGIYESINLGQSWSSITPRLRFLYQGAGFWEEIAGIVYSPEEPGVIYFAAGFGHGLYRWDRTAQKVTRLDSATPVTINTAVEEALNPGVATNPEGFQPLVLHWIPDPEPVAPDLKPNWILEETGRNTVKRYAATTGMLLATDNLNLSSSNGALSDPEKLARVNRASGKYGLYVRADYAGGKRLDGVLALAKKNGLNSIVVDCKDDSGFITYDTQLSLPRQAKAVRQMMSLPVLLEKAKANGIYVIGRVVVFQDPRLYRFNNYQYAVWDRVAGKPWGTKEFWVDPFAPAVWEYNLAIATELEKMGVDEVQFDYIRFPTDGETSKIKFRFRPEGAEKIDALESFLAMARERLRIPISTDLYGFSCWCRVEGLNAQNIEVIANYVDAVSPMFYPSHFSRNFMRQVEYIERARRIYYEGTTRAAAIAAGRCVIRPYVQAFLLGAERRMSAVSLARYLPNQIRGELASPSPGFTLWDYSQKYQMVRDLKPLLPGSDVTENGALKVSVSPSPTPGSDTPEPTPSGNSTSGNE